mgnify:CR=1 FL=1
MVASNSRVPRTAVEARVRLDDPNAARPHPRNLINREASVKQGEDILVQAGVDQLSRAGGARELIELAQQRDPGYVAGIDKIMRGLNKMTQEQKDVAFAEIEGSAQRFSLSTMVSRNMKWVEEFSRGWDAAKEMTERRWTG